MAGTAVKYWRRILASSAVYAAGGWAVVEALTTIVERFGLAGWLVPLVIAVYVAGLPVTIYLVWRTAGIERRLTWPSFVGAMSFLVAASASIFWFTRPAPPAETLTLAVLPCVAADESGDAWRAEGFAADIHARLSRVGAVKIISWNSSLFVTERNYAPPEIAEVLSVQRLLRCQMGSDGDRLAVSAQLLDPAGQLTLWSRDYDFVVEDIGIVVTELARAVLDILTTPVEAAEFETLNDIGTFSPQAYDLYLRAIGGDDDDDVDALLTSALEIDPNYAEAIIARAQNRASQLIWAEYESPEDLDQLRDATALMRVAAEKALAIDPQVIGAQGLLSRACNMERHYLGQDCPVDVAESHRREECKILSGTADGWACQHWLSSSEGQDSGYALERWLELEPTNFSANMQLMAHLWQSGRREEMVAVFETLQVLDPDDLRPYGLISNLLRTEGRLDEVLAWRMKFFSDGFLDRGMANWRLASDHMNLGLYEQAEPHAAIIHRARPILMPRWVAEIWVRRGEIDEATELLDWASDVLGGGGVSGAFFGSVYAFIDVLGDFETARSLFVQALAEKDLATLCEQDDACILLQSIYLHRTAQWAGEKAEASGWLDMAETAFDRMAPYEPGEPTKQRTKTLEALLRVAQDRQDEALAALREAVFGFEVADNDLALPIYVLDRTPLLDSLRERAEFQAILADYEAHLEPMRQRVLQATEAGDWQGLRQRTLQWLGGDLE